MLLFRLIGFYVTPKTMSHEDIIVGTIEQKKWERFSNAYGMCPGPDRLRISFIYHR